MFTMEFFYSIKRNINFKKFFFLLHLETGGVFINSYNLWLSLSAILCSFFITTTIKLFVSVGLYIGSIFFHIALIAISLVALKGLETNSRIKICLGFIPTASWLLIFFAMIIVQSFYGIQVQFLLEKSDVFGVMILYCAIHVYMLAYYTLMFIST